MRIHIGYERSTAEPVDIEMGPTELAYLAGIIDGEGSITIARSGWKLSRLLELSNTDKILAEWFNKVGSGRVSPLRWEEPPRYRSDPPWFQRKRKLWRWKLNGFRMLPLLEAVIPYLTVKRPQAELVARFIRLRRRRAHDLPKARNGQFIGQVSYSEAEREIAAEVRRLNTS